MGGMQDIPTIPITTNDCNDVPRIISVMIVPANRIELDVGFSTSPIFTN